MNPGKPMWFTNQALVQGQYLPPAVVPAGMCIATFDLAVAWLTLLGSLGNGLSDGQQVCRFCPHYSKQVATRSKGLQTFQCKVRRLFYCGLALTLCNFALRCCCCCCCSASRACTPLASRLSMSMPHTTGPCTTTRRIEKSKP